MNIGILPERIYKRSVERIVHKYNKDKGVVCNTNIAYRALLCMKVGRIGRNYELIASEMGAVYSEAWIQAYAAAADKPAGMQAQICLPEDYEESELRTLITELVSQADKYNLYIYKVDVRTQADIVTPQITLCVLGKYKEDKALDTSEDKKNIDIIQIGYCAEWSGCYLANSRAEELRERYSANYIRRMQESSLGILESGEVSSLLQKLHEDGLIYSVGEGGIFGALWNIGECCGCGLNVYLKKINIRQETIELFDYFDVNPYIMYSPGCVLALVHNAEEYLDECVLNSPYVGVIGHLTTNNDRVIINNDEKRFLTEHVTDEIYSITRDLL